VQRFFLASRCELLDMRRWQETRPEWLISDFWFAQSLAHSEVLLAPEAQEQHKSEVLQAASRVMDATLVVWLDAPASELAARVRLRARDFEARIGEDFLSSLKSGFARVFASPLAPPAYSPRATNLQELTEELVVVARAISG
jgi:deoxyadenosine/deoxycytidine kinase